MNVDLKSEFQASMRRQLEAGMRHQSEIPKKPYKRKRLYPNSRPKAEGKKPRGPSGPSRKRKCHYCPRIVDSVAREDAIIKCSECRKRLRTTPPRRHAKCVDCGKPMMTEQVGDARCRPGHCRPVAA